LSAVVDQAVAALPLLTDARPDRVFAWHNRQPLSVGRFIADVRAAAAALPGPRMR